ncbi:MAG TPA: AAA family ATPase, partial [Pirellulaceae bacterium]|nr:AAA family ATPase [Pirellulaceae bacterium]
MSTFGTDPNAAIEFTCQACSRLLRVPPSAAGRQVKCPQCNAVQMVTAAAPPTPGAFTPPPTFTPPPAQPNFSYNTPSPVEPSPAYGANSVAPIDFSTPVTAAPAVTPLATPPSNYAGRDTATKRLFDRITAEIGKIYVGQDELVLGALVALFSSGHVLIESVPGLGKTLFVRTLGAVLGCKFGRIQFTADLMPSDITGAPIFDMKQSEFRFRAGPVFTQFLLADEINRSPAKTHAALLEIMQEYRVTIDGHS